MLTGDPEYPAESNAMNDEAAVNFEHLRQRVGTRVVHRGVKCTLVEVLEDEGSVVLEACHKFSDMQSGQSGNAMRRVPRIVTVPVYTGKEKRLNPEFLALGLH